MIRLIFQNKTSACITCRKILINENISIEKSLNPSDPNFVQLVQFSIKRKGFFFNLNIYSSTSAHLGVIFKQICSQINLGNFCSLLHFKICRFRDNTVNVKDLPLWLQQVDQARLHIRAGQNVYKQNTEVAQHI